jgi:hypothetical protein
MHDHDCGGHRKNREAWRFEREAKRAAWRARFAARRAGRGDWSHFKDPKFWGLDAESMKQWGFTGAAEASGMPGMPPSAEEMAQLKTQVAEMEKTIASMQQRIIVLEKLVVDDDAILAREIEKLRDKPAGGK